MTCKVVMTPAPGERRVGHVGDRVEFRLRCEGGGAPSGELMGYLRTNLGRARVMRREFIELCGEPLKTLSRAWRNVAMAPAGEGEWSIWLTLTEPGYFQAKAYLADSTGRQYWPHGEDFGISVHPNDYRFGNTIYCAFPRMFGASKHLSSSRNPELEKRLKELDRLGYAVIPPSGKLRDVIREMPHIFETLQCRILHLLPVNPTPTTYARMGRYGSPYACQDLTAVDPALVEFDQRTTGVDQFCELTRAAHSFGGKVFLDMVINHTGWGATLHENHPEWFVRDEDGAFESPGAWGTVWEDLVELDPHYRGLWKELAEAFLIWCRRGVDGFRCDAGYKVPMPVWRYIIACVQEEFPDTLFFLEGLGGGWEDTKRLLTEGGMQWAYSELFQEYTGKQISGYQDHAMRQSRRVGLLVNYSETHDNLRLASRNRKWSLSRNRLCALTSVNGAYGFACGVEWLADERISVHGSSAMAWGNSDNIVKELRRLNELLGNHPCFFDGAVLERISEPGSAVYALKRASADGSRRVLVLINTLMEQSATLKCDPEEWRTLPDWRDLLGQSNPEIKWTPKAALIKLRPAASYCLSMDPDPDEGFGMQYRLRRSQAAFAVQMAAHVLDPEDFGPFEWNELACLLDDDPLSYLAACAAMEDAESPVDLKRRTQEVQEDETRYRRLRVWEESDADKVTLIPSEHWLVLLHPSEFRAELKGEGDSIAAALESIQTRKGWIAVAPPAGRIGNFELTVDPVASPGLHIRGGLRFLAEEPNLSGLELEGYPELTQLLGHPLCLLTNHRGAMSRICVDLGRIESKYDCLLGANLHDRAPVDRHVFVKRIRVWANANGIISALNGGNLRRFSPGPPALWEFQACAGGGAHALIRMSVEMADGENKLTVRFEHGGSNGPKSLNEMHLRLVVRLDLEDRNFHWETKRNPESERHLEGHSKPLDDRIGFEFKPDEDRRLIAVCETGQYHHESEWSQGVPHPLEQSRGQEGSGDAFSPGWFELPIPEGSATRLLIAAGNAAELKAAVKSDPSSWIGARRSEPHSNSSSFESVLKRAIDAFVVSRGEGKTLIAGYPWFLDWGRDTLIGARGLIEAGYHDDVKQILLTFGALEDQGTLPNSLHGEDASNRDTSDAPLWFGVVCEELAAVKPSGDAKELYRTSTHKEKKTLLDVLANIAEGHIEGAANGVRMDPESGLVWSPSHFTWMDTNYPAGTPRQGYPVEIQVLWIRLLRQLAALQEGGAGRKWAALADQARHSFDRYFWLESKGWFSDLLVAEPGQGAADAVVDDALRSNCLFAVSLDLVSGSQARRCVAATLRHLAVPGALRSLAPLKAGLPLPIRGPNGNLLNDPERPYWGRYEGDEDTRRKPAYHNGTAWVWTFPTFCEALAKAWEGSPEAVRAARSYLSSVDKLLAKGCLGQLPEILDGDAPHFPRGCDAQAWSVTETLRVWKRLERLDRHSR